MTIVERALELVPDGSRIGLGSGRAAQAFVKAVGVLPFALARCQRRLSELGCRPVPYVQGNGLFVTDNGNHILDCRIDPITDAPRLERDLRGIPGVVGTGLFLAMADTILVGDR